MSKLIELIETEKSLKSKLEKIKEDHHQKIGKLKTEAEKEVKAINDKIANRKKIIQTEVDSKFTQANDDILAQHQKRMKSLDSLDTSKLKAAKKQIMENLL